MRELGRRHDDKMNIIRSMATKNDFLSEQFLIPVNPTSTTFVFKAFIANIFQIMGLFVEMQLIMFVKMKHNRVIVLK